MLRGSGAQDGKMRAGARDPERGTFRRFNLNDEFWSVDSDGPFDLVFCRNVLMYFEAGRRERVLRRIVTRLPPRGYLFLGDAEGLTGFQGLRMVAPGIHTLKTNTAAVRSKRRAMEGGAVTKIAPPLIDVLVVDDSAVVRQLMSSLLVPPRAFAPARLRIPWSPWPRCAGTGRT